MDLAEYAAASELVVPNHAILIYGPPKMGKTRFAGTAAKIPQIKRIFFIDIENGVQTLTRMGLTVEEMKKVTLIKIPNTRANPIAIETLIKMFCVPGNHKICVKHGKVGCRDCAVAKDPVVEWNLKTLTHEDLVIIDSGSELGDSALSAACKNLSVDSKPSWDEYFAAGKWLGDICSVIQQCESTNFMVITHEIMIEDDSKKKMIYPLMGTSNFSMKVAKYFGTVIYATKKLGKHALGSSSTYRPDLMTGSRVNIALEKFDDATMADLLIKGGIIKA